MMGRPMRAPLRPSIALRRLVSTSNTKKSSFTAVKEFFARAVPTSILPQKVVTYKRPYPEIDFSKVKYPELPVIQDMDIYDKVFQLNGRKKDGKLKKMEFLGDSILAQATTFYLFDAYPNFKVKDIFALRTEIIKNSTLTEIAMAYNFHKQLPQSILSDAFEIYIGGLAYDNRMNVIPVQMWIYEIIESILEQTTYRHFQLTDILGYNSVDVVDLYAKTKLLILLGKPPEYQIIEKNGGFKVRCIHNQKVLGIGKDRNKFRAGVKASMNALDNYPILNRHLVTPQDKEVNYSIKLPLELTNKPWDASVRRLETLLVEEYNTYPEYDFKDTKGQVQTDIIINGKVFCRSQSNSIERSKNKAASLLLNNRSVLDVLK